LEWKYIGVTTNDSFIVDGVDIFKEQWKNTGKIAHVVDPLYGKKLKFTVWEIKISDRVITFAAGEFSNNVFGIYIQ